MRTIVVFEVTTNSNARLWKWALLAGDGVGTERVHFTEPGPDGKHAATPVEGIASHVYVFQFQVRDSAVK